VGWVRLAATREGAVQIGRTVPGRGAWLCSAACIAPAFDRGALARALRRKLTNPEAEALRARLESLDF
jgi:predicted RNA-binding protein YlxR (DUF448 family)